VNFVLPNTCFSGAFKLDADDFGRLVEFCDDTTTDELRMLRNHTQIDTVQPNLLKDYFLQKLFGR
jgi:hypothetical protein